jgi:hypothetical protein
MARFSGEVIDILVFLQGWLRGKFIDEVDGSQLGNENSASHCQLLLNGVLSCGL